MERLSGLSILQTALALSFFNKLPPSLIKQVFSIEFMDRLDVELRHCYSKVSMKYNNQKYFYSFTLSNEFSKTRNKIIIYLPLLYLYISEFSLKISNNTVFFMLGAFQEGRNRNPLGTWPLYKGSFFTESHIQNRKHQKDFHLRNSTASAETTSSFPQESQITVRDRNEYNFCRCWNLV